MKPNAFARLALIALAGCAADAPPPPLEAPLPVFTPPAPPPPPRTDADRDNDFVGAWAQWEAGHKDEALVVFKRLVKELGQAPTPTRSKVRGVAEAPEPGVPSAPVAASADGSRGVALSGGDAYWFDGSGAPLRHDVVEASTVRFLPQSTLVAFSGKNLTVVDAQGFVRVLRAPNVTDFAVSEDGGLIAYQETPEDDAPKLHVWSVWSRSERSGSLLQRGESIEATSLGFSPDRKEVHGRVFGPSGSYSLALFDEAGARIDFPAPFDASPPSYSSDGKLLAYGYRWATDTAQGGKTLLVDRATRKTIATSSAIGYPTATRFSKSGKLLLVGELRKLSILEVPSLRVLASTGFLRASSSIDDDLQNVSDIEIVGNDAAFWASTADGTSAVFRLPAGTLVWKGRGERSIDTAGVQRFLDRAEKNQLVTIDAKLAVTTRALTQAEIDAPYPTLDDPRAEKLRSALEGTVCTLRERVFPLAACR